MAAECGVDPATAKKAWEHGWPNKAFPSVKSVLEERDNEARQKAIDAHAERRESASAERARLRKAAENTHKNELAIVSLATSGVVQVLNASTKLLPIVEHLAAACQAKIIRELGLPPSDERALTATQAVALLDKLAAAQGRVVALATSAMNLDRLIQDKPGAIAKTEPVQEMTLHEAETRIIAAAHSLERAKVLANRSTDSDQPLVGTLVKRPT